MNHYSERGSGLFMIFFAIAAFAALSYVLSRDDSGIKDISSEKLSLQADDVIDMGSKLKDAVARIRLRGVSETKISFENSTVSGYTNSSCSVDSCKVFAFDGGGKEWEVPVNDINGGANWGIAGNIAVTNIGTAAADLIAVLPALSIDLCRKINAVLSVDSATATPPTIAALPAAQFTGSYSGSPTTISNATINGKISGCAKVTSATGTAISGTPLSNSYIYYQILIGR